MTLTSRCRSYDLTIFIDKRESFQLIIHIIYFTLYDPILGRLHANARKDAT